MEERGVYCTIEPKEERRQVGKLFDIIIIGAGVSGSACARELSRLKAEARNKHAIAVIWAYWLGSKVLEMHIPSLPSWNLQ